MGIHPHEAGSFTDDDFVALTELSREPEVIATLYGARQEERLILALRGADAVRELTQLFTTRLGEFVRRYPEQYFWAHRRWKTQPEGGEPASDPTPDGVVDPPAARH